MLETPEAPRKRRGPSVDGGFSGGARPPPAAAAPAAHTAGIFCRRSIMKATAAILLVVTLLACTLFAARVEPFTPSPTPRAAAPAVVGGVPAAMSRYPWFCSFYVRQGGQLLCGGVLIAPDTILTAKHVYIQPGYFVVIGGTTGAFGDSRAVKEVIAIAGFDLVLVKLWTPSTKQPIKLATRLPPSGTMVTLLGRGMKSGDWNHAGDAALTKARLQYLDRAKTLRWLLSEPHRPNSAKLLSGLIDKARDPTLLAAISKNKSGCGGDSGGPLIIERGPGQDELLGIVHGGAFECELAGTQLLYNFFVSVPQYVASRGPK